MIIILLHCRMISTVDLDLDLDKTRVVETAEHSEATAWFTQEKKYFVMILSL